jgi:hypothetical protein
MVDRKTSRLRALADDRVEEMRFGRWLANPRIRMSELDRTAGEQVRRRVGGLHVLAIQDTSELNYKSHARRTCGLGTVGNGRDRGLFVHPVEAASGSCLGLVGAQIYARHKAAAADYRDQPIEHKESMRWLRNVSMIMRQARLQFRLGGSGLF